MNSSYALEAVDVVKSYPDSHGEGRLIILNGVRLRLNPAERVAIVGPSGSGKSTLLHLLGGLDRPDSGSIKWSGEEMTGWSSDRLARERNRHIGFVFQFHHLLPEFTALENVLMPSLIAGDSDSVARERARYLLERLGLAERLDHRPSQLSGGEQQRVAMARALMNRPRLLLADEPTGNLDKRHSDLILQQLDELREEEGVSMLLITHDMELASDCDRQYRLQEGKLMEALQGAPLG
ncbi:MAG: ABC transporter ATP-binding protein [Balneolaceae bacterium]